MLSWPMADRFHEATCPSWCASLTSKGRSYSRIVDETIAPTLAHKTTCPSWSARSGRRGHSRHRLPGKFVLAGNVITCHRLPRRRIAKYSLSGTHDCADARGAPAHSPARPPAHTTHLARLIHRQLLAPLLLCAALEPGQLRRHGASLAAEVGPERVNARRCIRQLRALLMQRRRKRNQLGGLGLDGRAVGCQCRACIGDGL
eukprot:355302-Chlamydomonas_euryale.AAC.10